MGWFSSDKAPVFTPDFSGSNAAVNQIGDIATGDINGLSQSGQVQSGLMNNARRRSLNDLKAAQAGRMATTQNQMAMSGGLTAGSGERLAAQSNRQGGLFSQQIIGDANRSQDQLLASDIGRQQALKNQAMFAMPGLRGGQEATGNAARAAAFQAANQAPGLNGWGQAIVGGATIVGGIYGGAAGAAGANMGTTALLNA